MRNIRKSQLDFGQVKRNTEAIMIVQFLMHEISKFNEAIEGQLKKTNVVKRMET